MNIKKILPWLYLGAGTIAWVFSMIIADEKYKLAMDASYIPPCTINPLISCVTVMGTWQASVFGFPNPFLGIAGFAVIMVLGFALLAGGSFSRWFWRLVLAGVTFAVGFIFWLFYQSVYSIGALCPYCMVVWAMTIPIFWYTVVYLLSEGHILVSEQYARVRSVLMRHHVAVLAALYGVIVIAILVQFWSYWSTLLR